jgi:hypothetical protein
MATGASNDTAYPGVESYDWRVDLCFTGLHESCRRAQSLQTVYVI